MSIAMQEWPRRHRISVEHLYRMADAGLFSADERVELIEGEIIDVPPMGSRQASAVERLATDLVMRVGSRAIVRTQLPLRLSDDSEPLPDVAVVTARADRYGSAHPGPADTLLVAEISDSTLRFDREVKATLYARHGIPEVWVIDLQAAQLHAFSVPRNGAYTAIVAEQLGPRSLAVLDGVTVDLAPLS